MGTNYLRCRACLLATLLLIGGVAEIPGQAGNGASDRSGGLVRVAKTEFPAEATIGSATVPLRGRHLLTWWGFKVYTAAFYAEPDRASYDAMLAADSPRKLVLRYHRRIEAADIARATEEMVGKNPNVDIAALRERLDRLYACYSDVRDGDEYGVAYDSEARTTTVALNGKIQCTIEGEDFAAAFFGIWLGPHSISPEMSRKLRGG